MLDTSNFIDAKNGAKEINKLLKEFQEVQALRKDLETKLKPIKARFEALQNAIIEQSKQGLNETLQYSWEFQINADSESIAPKKVAEKAPELYEALKANDLVSIKKGAKSIKNIAKK